MIGMISANRYAPISVQPMYQWFLSLNKQEVSDHLLVDFIKSGSYYFSRKISAQIDITNCYLSKLTKNHPAIV